MLSAAKGVGLVLVIFEYTYLIPLFQTSLCVLNEKPATVRYNGASYMFEFTNTLIGPTSSSQAGVQL